MPSLKQPALQVSLEVVVEERLILQLFTDYYHNCADPSKYIFNVIMMSL